MHRSLPDRLKLEGAHSMHQTLRLHWDPDPDFPEEHIRNWGVHGDYNKTRETNPEDKLETNEWHFRSFTHLTGQTLYHGFFLTGRIIGPFTSAKKGLEILTVLI